MAQTRITETEVRSFADKLAAFGQTLSRNERLLLEEVLVRAHSTMGHDVTGHDISGGAPAHRDELQFPRNYAIPLLDIAGF